MMDHVARVVEDGRAGVRELGDPCVKFASSKFTVPPTFRRDDFCPVLVGMRAKHKQGWTEHVRPETVRVLCAGENHAHPHVEGPVQFAVFKLACRYCRDPMGLGFAESGVVG